MMAYPDCRRIMDPKYYGFIEIAFTASVVLGLGFWQLWSLRRLGKGSRKSERKRSS